jgi:hypothetical protein
VREFIAALRQLRCPIVMIAAAILVVQTLVAGLATAHAAARLATFDTDAGTICHGNGEEGAAPAGQAAHECCTFCTTAGPVTLSPGTVVLGHLAILRHADPLTPSRDLHRLPRAIRAGASQAPPANA